MKWTSYPWDGKIVKEDEGIKLAKATVILVDDLKKLDYLQDELEPITLSLTHWLMAFRYDIVDLTV